MRWRGIWGRLGIAVVVASIFMTGAIVAVNRGINDRVAKIRRVNLTLAAAPPGGANYLIIGSDSRAFVDNPADAAAFGDPADDPSVSGQRSDTMMVAHVEPSAQRTFVVSFPRDLMVHIPGYQGENQINGAYSLGGAQLVADTLKANFDIDINHYLEVNFKSFEEVVNEIGNVQVYIPGRARDEETGLNTPFGAGCYPLDGPAALAYVRARHIEIADPDGDIVDPETGEHWKKLDDWSDISRITRQQQFIRKLAGLAISKGLSDPFLALSLADNVLGYVKADQNLSRDDVNALVRAFKTVNVNDTNSIRFETLPIEAYPPDPNRVQAAPDADQVVAQLRTFGDNTPKAAVVAPADVRVAVSDASGTNVGSSTVKALLAQGFRASLAPGSKKVDVTELRYGYGQTEEAKELLTYFPDAKLVPDATAKRAVKLVIGTSFAGTITVPSTTTTTAAPAGTPTTTAPPTTTTTQPPLPSDPCRQ
jgi:LCP family protein required for cell wall assembly